MTARTRGVMVAAVVLAFAACTSASPDATPTATPSAPADASPGTDATSPPPSSTPSGPTDGTGPVGLRPPEGGSFLVRGTYPHSPSSCVRPDRPSLLARYPGTLSIRRDDDGTLSIVVTVSFERYLEGIAEVPPSWPPAALEAQAVAARTYALATTGWDGAEGEPLDTPICATTSCQVYRGIPVPFDPAVRNWYAAVRRTSGRVLVFEGRPAETVYFSTSDGQTYGNDEVFGSAPLPYLRPVIERDDGASPTSRWSVRVPFADMATFLHEAGAWPPARTISEVRLDGTTVVVSGDGASRSMELSTFRDAVNVWAPCLAPDRYPTDSLPITIPSRWMTVSPSGTDAVVVTGRGWGHGAGMVQWGAYGKALRGLSASDILAYYYGGLRPQDHPEPGTIHVQVAGGLTSLRITPSGPGATLDGNDLEPGRVIITGGDEITVATEPSG